MQLKDKKAIFLDAADTLFYIRLGLGETYARPAKKYGADPSPDSLKKAFSIHFNSAPPLAFRNVTDKQRKDLEREWWYEVVKNVYKDVGMFRDFDRYFNELFELFRTSAWEIFPETIPVLKKLREKGYMIAVVSNFDSRVYDVCSRLGISEYIDDFTISSEAGYAKPDPEIFRITLARNNLDTRECVHIGDNFENDYKSPKSIGISSVFLDRERREKNREVLSISNLYELLDHL